MGLDARGPVRRPPGQAFRGSSSFISSTGRDISVSYARRAADPKADLVYQRHPLIHFSGGFYGTSGRRRVGQIRRRSLVASLLCMIDPAMGAAWPLIGFTD
jgi:hypothetical protein